VEMAVAWGRAHVDLSGMSVNNESDGVRRFSERIR
jgi:hypothetical protein